MVTSVADVKQNVLDVMDYFNRTLAKPCTWTYRGRPLVVEMMDNLQGRVLATQRGAQQACVYDNALSVLECALAYKPIITPPPADMYGIAREHDQ